MDGWKDRAKSGQKESGFENLKTRFQDCNLSRKQESKLSGWNENGLPVNQDSKLPIKKTAHLQRLKAKQIAGRQGRKQTRQK